MCFQRGIQRFFGGLVVYEFNTDEQAAAANVADKGVVVQGAVQFGAQLLAARHDVFQQMIRVDDMLHGKRRGTGRGVAHIGVAVLKEAAAADNGVVDPVAGQHSAYRLIARAQALGNREYVRRDTVLRAREAMAGAPHSGHDFIQDKQDRKSNTSELQSLMRISYAVFCLKKKKQHSKNKTITN